LRQIRLYEPFCAARGFSLLYPERQNDLLEVIRAVKAGRIAAHELRILNEVARELVDSGAHALVLGCTEFSVIANRLDADLPVFDTLQVLAEEIVSHVKDIASADHSRRSPHMK
jgi:aspartate racemase